MKCRLRVDFLKDIEVADVNDDMWGYTFHADLNGNWVMGGNTLSDFEFEGTIEQALVSDLVAPRTKRFIIHNLDLFSTKYWWDPRNR